VIRLLLIFIVVAGALIAAYAWFEAGWLRRRVLELEIPGLPAALDGVRIGHLSDFHLGAPLSRGNGASLRAAAWVAERAPELVVVTGDLVSHPRGEPRLRAIMALLRDPLVVLGNHDVAVTRDPFSRAAELDDLAGATLLRDEAVDLEVNGVRVQVVGVDAEQYPEREARPWTHVDPSAPFRLLLCHFPGIVRRVPPGMFQLTLAGHLHGGQICVPVPGRGPLTLAHPRARFIAGAYTTPAGPLHLSPGTGTTFVPFRLFARPEVTELVLRAPARG
jgi:uncharacterized protein